MENRLHLRPMASALLYSDPVEQAISPDAGGLSITAFACHLKDSRPAFPEVAEALLTSGKPDLLLIGGVVAELPDGAAHAMFHEFAGDFGYHWVAAREQHHPGSALATYHLIFSTRPACSRRQLILPADSIERYPTLYPQADRAGWLGPRCALHAEFINRDQLFGVTVMQLESDTCPAGRARQLDGTLRKLQEGRSESPALIFGGFHTHLLDSTGKECPTALAQRIEKGDPHAFLNPVSREPLFAVAAAHGYTWDAFNEPFRPTTHHPFTRRPAKLDWIFGRGLSHQVRRIASAPLLARHSESSEQNFTNALVLELNPPIPAVQHEPS